jgi:serine/threonine protein kinase
MVSGEAEVGREDPSEDPFVGTLLNGRFQIVKRIARGGMASVYFATQVPLSRHVAIKVVRCVNPGSEEDFRRRFLREASILAQLQHPNIVTLLDYGPINDMSEEHYFMAMEYLRGETLAKRFKRTGRLRIDESIRIARQIGRGLREAHRRGFIHRDLKPSNIMLVPEDDNNDIVKLVDFGIGKIVPLQAEIPVNKDSEEMTRVGLLLGSPRYMSPEQIRSEPVELRTDLYGLGVILFQALTGRLPFEGRTEVEVLIAHCSIEPPELGDVCPNQFFPESLSRLVRSLLEKKAKNRPTVEEFLEQLAGIEEEVFGTVSLAGPTLQGLSIPPPPFRPPIPTSSALPLLGPPVSRPTWERLTEAEAAELDSTPVLGTGLPLPIPVAAPRREIIVAGVSGVLLFALVSALFWIVANRSHRDPDAESASTAGRTSPKVRTLAVSKAPEPVRAPTGTASSLAPRSYTLNIDSVPTAAIVSEGDRIIGATPLTLTVDRRSVATGPRHFVLKREGYLPFVLEQGDSMTTAQVSAALLAIGRGGSERAHRYATRRGGYANSTSVAEVSGAPSVIAGGRSSRPSRTGAISAAMPELAPAINPAQPRNSGGHPPLEIRTRR